MGPSTNSLYLLEVNNDLKGTLDLMETLFRRYLLLQVHINIYLKLLTKALG